MIPRIHSVSLQLAVVLSSLWLWHISIPAASATHLIDHRITIYGSVRDGTSFPGKALAATTVIVRDSATGTIMQQGVTDEQGRFRLVLHVHNEDLGKELTILSQGSEAKLILAFNPQDTSTERQQRIDLVVFPPSP